MNLPPSRDPLPNNDLRARVMAAVRAAPAPSRSVGLRRRVSWVVLALAFWAVVSWAIGLPGLRGRPFSYVACLAVAWLAVGGAATWAGVARGGSMLGRPAVWRTATVVLTPIALLATSLALSVVWPETLIDRSSIDRHLLCVVGTAGFALGPLGVFVGMWRASDPVAPRLAGAAIATAAGAWGALAIELHCQFTSPFHVVVGHVLPVAMLTIGGLYVGRRLLAVSS